jgi:hypothetical protein
MAASLLRRYAAVNGGNGELWVGSDLSSSPTQPLEVGQITLPLGSHAFVTGLVLCADQAIRPASTFCYRINITACGANGTFNVAAVTLIGSKHPARGLPISEEATEFGTMRAFAAQRAGSLPVTRGFQWFAHSGVEVRDTSNAKPLHSGHAGQTT